MPPPQTTHTFIRKQNNEASTKKPNLPFFVLASIPSPNGIVSYSQIIAQTREETNRNTAPKKSGQRLQNLLHRAHKQRPC